MVLFMAAWFYMVVGEKENTAIAHSTTPEKQAEDNREEFQGSDVICGP